VAELETARRSALARALRSALDELVALHGA
jgi:hypothetical protein